MNFLQSLLAFLDTKMKTPELYGWYHLLALAITGAITVLLCRHYRKASAAQLRRFLLVVSSLVLALEIYKQINFSFRYDDGISFDFQWYAFPFQFCSTPMYIGLLAGFTKDGKLHRAACAYLASYSVFAGICVMLYPSTVFVEAIGINIQTMICHGAMIAVGACLLYSGYVQPSGKMLLRAMAVFAGCMALAMVLNEVAFRTGLLETEDFNMFFISPHSAPSLPVYSLVQEVVPFPFCLVLYFAGFTAAAGLILLIGKGLLSLQKTGRFKNPSVAA